MLEHSAAFNAAENSNAKNCKIRLFNVSPFPNTRGWNTNQSRTYYFKLLWNCKLLYCFSLSFNKCAWAYSDFIALLEFLWSSNIKKKSKFFCDIETMCILWRPDPFLELIPVLRTPKLTWGYSALRLKKQRDLRIHMDWQHLALLDWSQLKSQINHFQWYNCLPDGSYHPAKPFIS